MRSAITMVSAFASLVLLVGCSRHRSPDNPAGAGPADRYDLVCSGEMTDLLFWGRRVENHEFTIRIHVNASAGTFRFDGWRDSFHLTHKSAARIEYAYDPAVADVDHSANQSRVKPDGLEGPFEDRDTWSVDLKTGAFTRNHVYAVGDAAAVQHDETFTGRCDKAPYSNPPWTGELQEVPADPHS